MTQRARRALARRADRGGPRRVLERAADCVDVAARRHEHARGRRRAGREPAREQLLAAHRLDIVCELLLLGQRRVQAGQPEREQHEHERRADPQDSRPARDLIREPREHAALRALIALAGARDRRPERAPAGDQKRGWKRGQAEHHRERHARGAERADRLGAAHPGEQQREQRRDDRAAGREDRRGGVAQRGPHRHVRVLLAFELLPVAGDQQQRVVRRRAEDQDGQDAAALAGDRQARRAEQVSGPAGSRLGEDDDEERDRPEDRRAVDEHEQDQDDRAGDRQQRHVEALEHAADVGRERRAARHRDLQAVTAALVAADPLAQAGYGLVGRVVVPCRAAGW